MKFTIMKLICCVVATSGIALLAGCNTVAGTVNGAGQDIRSVTGAPKNNTQPAQGYKKEVQHHAYHHVNKKHHYKKHTHTNVKKVNNTNATTNTNTNTTTGNQTQQ